MPRSPDRIQRFTPGERWIHLTFGSLMGVCILTAAMLYWAPLSTLVGRRDLVETVHFTAGLLLPLPLVFGALASRAFRADVRRLNRFLPGDVPWLRSSQRRSGAFPSGKFNAGQKLNSAITLGSVIVLFATGMIMFWSGLFPENIRTGATFVHDWLALAFGILVLDHIYMAFNDATARAGMRTGYVPEDWARREHGAWAAEVLDRT